MRKLLIHVGCAAITFGVGMAVHQFKPAQNVTTQHIHTRENQSGFVYKVDTFARARPIDPLTLSDLFTSHNHVALYNGYLIEKRYKHSDDSLERIQEYVSISKHGRKALVFDAMGYHPLGNNADFDFVSLLGSSSHQLAISQEVPRGGVQWIVDLSSKPRVIFDGDAWGVGRETADCELRDLDGDGIFELRLPMTDFYSFMDKMAVGNIPTPAITFKYNVAKGQFFPANHLLRLDVNRPPDLPTDGDDLYFRSQVLQHLLDLIYVGKRKQAWQYFNSTYNLNDKKEIERRVKDILRRQAVYKYIYKTAKHTNS